MRPFNEMTPITQVISEVQPTVEAVKPEEPKPVTETNLKPKKVNHRYKKEEAEPKPAEIEVVHEDRKV